MQDRPIRRVVSTVLVLLAFFFMAPASGLAQFQLQTYVPAPDTSEVKAPSGALAPQPPGLRYIPPSLNGQGFNNEVEPNGTSATATPLGSSSTVVLGNVFPAADVDFYSFAAQANDRVYVAVQTLFDASASGDSVLDVLNVDGTTVLENDPNDGTFNASSSTIAGRLIPANGTYFVRVRHNVATGTIRPYHLQFTLQRGAPTPEVEPNNSTAAANPLPASGWVSGTITAVSPGEADLFSINLAAGDSVFVSLDMNPERDAAVWNGRAGMGFFGNPPVANQLILLANDANAGAAPADPNSEAFFFTVKDAGTYFVYVDSIVAAGLGANATYHLSVAVRPHVPATANCTTYTSTNVPQTIPTGPGMVSSTLTVPGNPRIADLDVSINLNHTFMQDLDVHLISPAGNDNGLFSDVGAATVGGVQTLMDVRLDDEAALPWAFAVSAGMLHQPELAYRLDWFDGEDAGGTWTLVLRDDATGDGGTLNAWSLTICEPPPPPSCAPGFVAQTVFSTDFESGDAGFTHSGATDEWERGLPTFAPITTCNSGVNCWKTDLDNTYNPGVVAGTPQDLLSPPINLAGLSAPVVVRWAQRYQIESASFDRSFVDYQQVGGATPVRLWEWLAATMTDLIGNPTVTINESSGWSQISARADSLAGLNTELRFNLTSDNTVQLAGLAIDDVSVTACRQLSADVQITKTDGVATAVPGGSVTYTIVASNPTGPDPVVGGSVTDTFPATLNCTWTCVGAGGGTCTAGPVAGNIADTVNLPVGGTATYTAVCTIAASATGSLSNTASISSPINDPNAGNNSATDTDTLTPMADVAITKTDGVTTAVPGQSVTYTITASNPGPSNAPGSSVADTFPAPLTCSWTCVGAGGGTCTAGPVAGNIADSVNLPAGGSVTYTASCTIAASATGSLSNTATVTGSVTDPNAGNNSATDTDTLTPQADLQITKTDGVTTAIPGQSVTYTITANNPGPSNAPGSSVADTFPASLTCTWTCVGAGGGTCTAGPVAGNIADTVNLPVGGSVTYTATCTISASATGTLSNTATVATGAGVTDPVPGNNSATDTDTLTPQADLAITKTDGVITTVPGQSVTYTITASNAGPGNAPGSTVSDTFPASLTCTWTCVGAGGGTCTAGPVAGNIADTVNLPAGGSVTYTASCTIGSSATGSLSNTATVSGSVVDPTPGNNSATDTDTLTPMADVAITKTDGVASAVPGQSVTYTITASNAGPSDAPGSMVTDTFPGTLSCTWTCAPAGGASCTAGPVGGNIADSVNLPAGGSVTYTASCTIASSATGNLSNTAMVTGSVTDPNAGNNSATDTDTLTPQADLSVTKTDGLTGASPGQAITYTIVASNSGPSDAPGTSVNDTFPAALTGVTWTCAGMLGGTCTGAGAGNIADIANLPAGASVTYTVNATIDGAFTGTLSNTATVAAGAGVTDPAAGNNSATDTTTVSSAANLSGTKSVTGDFSEGGTIFYTIVITNSSPTAQLDDPGSDEFTDTLPAQLTLVDVTATSGTPGMAGNTAIWNGMVPGNGMVTITIEAVINAGTTGQTIINQGTISFDADGDGINDTSVMTDDPSTPSGGDGTGFMVTLQGLEIPTLSQWGLALLALLLAAGALAQLRRRG